MKYVATIDSDNELSEDVIESIKRTLFVGDERKLYCFEIESITKMSEFSTGSENKVGWSSAGQDHFIEKLPSVTPTRKKGFWIMTNDYITAAYGTIDYVKCSCCSEECLEEGNYCPNCGAEMESEE